MRRKDDACRSQIYANWFAPSPISTKPKVIYRQLHQNQKEREICSVQIDRRHQLYALKPTFIYCMNFLTHDFLFLAFFVNLWFNIMKDESHDAL